MYGIIISGSLRGGRIGFVKKKCYISVGGGLGIMSDGNISPSGAT